MSVTEVTGLVNLFQGMLMAMEGRLTAKLDDSAKLATERWLKHDADLERNRAAIVARFEKVEKAILTVEQALEQHLDKERVEEIETEARVRPVRTTIGWLWAHWRDLVLLFIGIVAAATFALDWLTHLINGSGV